MAMIPTWKTTFKDLVPPRAELLQRLEAEAEQERIPIVGPVVGELLFILARAMGARRILELGTATGYSAIYLAQAVAPESGQVITLELIRPWPGAPGRISPLPACRLGLK